VKYFAFGVETVIIGKRWKRPDVSRMVCRVCGRTPVLRYVGKVGYCGAHTEQAFAKARARLETFHGSDQWRYDEM